MNSSGSDVALRNKLIALVVVAAVVVAVAYAAVELFGPEAVWRGIEELGAALISGEGDPQ